MGDRNWQGEPVLAAKFGPGDHFFRYSAIYTEFELSYQVYTSFIYYQ